MLAFLVKTQRMLIAANKVVKSVFICTSGGLGLGGLNVFFLNGRFRDFQILSG